MATQPTNSAAYEAGVEEVLERVRKHLDLDTMETRRRDALDFHEISVASIRTVVRVAFDAGYKARAKAGQPTA